MRARDYKSCRASIGYLKYNKHLTDSKQKSALAWALSLCQSCFLEFAVSVTPRGYLQDQNYQLVIFNSVGYSPVPNSQAVQAVVLGPPYFYTTIWARILF